MLDDIQFYGMLDDLNNEIMKIKELFMNDNETVSSKKCKRHNKTKKCNGHMFAAGAEYIDNEKSNFNQQSTFVTQNSTAEYEKYNPSQFENGINNNNSDIEFYPNNSEVYYTNNEPYFPQQTNDGFYQIQSAPADLKNKNVDSIQHFFSWQNPHVCQCGMIYNNK